MKIACLVCLGLIVLGVLLSCRSKNQSALPAKQPPTIEKADPTDNPYRDLRGRIFSATPAEIGLTANGKEEWPYAIVMDIGLPEGTATLVAIVDGNASLYWSSGGGIIGGYGHENVRKAATDFVDLGAEYFSKMAAVDTFPLPKTDYVRFYLLTNKGKYTVEEKADDLLDDRSKWAKLFKAANNLLTALRSTTAMEQE